MRQKDDYLSVSVPISDDGGYFVVKVNGGNVRFGKSVPETLLGQFLFFTVIELCLP